MSALTFHRDFLDSLPGDEDEAPRSREVLGACWSRVQPTPVAAPEVLHWSPQLAGELGLDAAQMQRDETAQVLGGNRLWPGMAPYAANYGGHQFGHWAGQLGDGRAIVLGELERPDGDRVEVQLKGAGPTAYSRAGDGRAVLRSSLREYLCSEAMHALGVPTTRALSLVRTGDTVVRDMFYDGNPQGEPGAITCRVAPTFLRFGSYQLPMSRGDVDLVKQLVDFTLARWFPDLAGAGREGYAAWLREVAARTARLVAHWQAVGFVHGVLNTDNMSVVGLTIDYGPYGWTDDFQLGWTPNTTDARQRRYAFGNQPGVCLWNVARLCEAALPLLDGDAAPAEAALDHFKGVYAEAALTRFRAKLGLTGAADPGDAQLVQDAFDWLGREETDMTIFFRSLADVVGAPTPPAELPAATAAAFYGAPSAAHVDAGVAWLQRWWRRTRDEAVTPTAIAAQLRATNPKFVLRNWLSQSAIEAAEQGDLQPLRRLYDVMQRPFDEQPDADDLAQKRPEWARHKAGCSALSCSS
ncbi:MAG: protein adenylyltransferase SelO [Planctomycetota bacterium]